MKYIITTCLLLLGACSISNAQSYYIENERTFHGAVYAGGNFTQIDGDNYAGYSKMGLNVGGALYMFVNESFATSLEILYTEKGSRSKSNDLRRVDGILIKKFNAKLNYTEVPLLLHYFTKQRSHFGGGFAFSRIITSEQEIDATPISSIYSEGFFRQYDFSFIVNSNLRLWKGLFLNARFQYSLINMAKPEIVNQSPVFGRSEQYNNVWTFRLMYMFGEK